MRILSDAGIVHRVIDADKERDLAQTYQIVHAPTLIVPAAETERYSNAAEIRGYCEKVG